MSSVSVQFEPAGFAYREPAGRALLEVVRGLGLARRITSLTVAVRPNLQGDEGFVAWREVRGRAIVRIELDLGNFLTARGRRALARSGHTAISVPRRRYSDCTARRTFLHELSHVADALRHGIDSNDVPRGRWASFNEAWNVWIDGRLARRGTPSLTRSERWTAFHGEFRRRGRRRAWFARIFDRLWRADRLSQQDLLDAVDVLVG
ncbi:MAG: hypothetical protein ACREOU_15305 [Candidatus Eiseniibacteriota bacterium]